MLRRPRYKIVRADSDQDADEILDFQRRCFPVDITIAPEKAQWWFLYDDLGAPAAFIGYEETHEQDTLYLSRVGVLHAFRGLRLQRLLQNRTMRVLKRSKYGTIVTYTWNNPASANSLISSGFKNYIPSELWAGEVTYWQKTL